MSVTASRAPASIASPAQAFGWGLLGVLAFSLTLPMTRLAVRELDPMFVGLARAPLGAVLAGLILWWHRVAPPARHLWPRLALVALCSAALFPALTAWAMARVPSAHGAVLIGSIPLLTALGGQLRAREQPGRRFWLCALAGSALVGGFALMQGGGSLQPADLALFAAAAVAAAAYTEGTLLARELGTWQLSCWVLVGAGPVLAPFALWLGAAATASSTAWLGFGYVSLVSALLGFFAWYRGLALGGMARVGQLQLLQPFLTLLAAVLLFGESLPRGAISFALAVAFCVGLGWRSRLR